MQAVEAPMGNPHLWGWEQVNKCPNVHSQWTALGGALYSSQRSQQTKPLMPHLPFYWLFLHLIANSLTFLWSYLLYPSLVLGHYFWTINLDT